MSGKTALAKLRAKSRKAKGPSSKSELLEGLEDMIVADMVGAMSRIGEIADDVGDWRTTKVQVVAGYDGVEADVRLPKVPVVEMDGMILFDLMYQSASSVAMNVVQYFTERVQGGAYTDGTAYKAWVGDSKTGNHASDVVVRTMEVLMEGQGWRFVKGAWRSPAWLFPPMSIPRIAIQAHVNAEFDSKALLPDMVNEDDDQLSAIAEDL